MFRLLRDKRLIVLLVSLIVFIALMGLTLQGSRSGLTWPEKMIRDSVVWTQSLIYRPAAAVAGFFHDVARLHRTYEENEALRRTLAQYAKDRARLNGLEQENERLKEALNYTERQKKFDDRIYHIASVIGYSPDPFNQTITVNLGSNDGIRTNMAVTSVKGLIGRVTTVTPFSANVQLLTSLDEQVRGAKPIAATVLNKENSFGIIQSYNREKNVLMMTKIAQEDPIEVGDLVISSGLGQVFPAGLEIGTVARRYAGSYGLTHVAEVKPSADFGLLDLREVFIVEIPVEGGE